LHPLEVEYQILKIKNQINISKEVNKHDSSQEQLLCLNYVYLIFDI